MLTSEQLVFSSSLTGYPSKQIIRKKPDLLNVFIANWHVELEHNLLNSSIFPAAKFAFVTIST